MKNSSTRLIFLITIIVLILCILLISRLKKQNELKEKIPNTISGIVRSGSGYGKPFFDYPTANIDNHEKLGCGVYTASSNYGDCIVFSFDSSRLECHIKNFNGNLYNKKIVLKNIKKLDSKVDNDKYPIINIFNNGCKMK